jgi:hypothetical protein
MAEEVFSEEALKTFELWESIDIRLGDLMHDTNDNWKPMVPEALEALRMNDRDKAERLIVEEIRESETSDRRTRLLHLRALLAYQKTIVYGVPNPLKTLALMAEALDEYAICRGLRGTPLGG